MKDIYKTQINILEIKTTMCEMKRTLHEINDKLALKKKRLVHSKT